MAEKSPKNETEPPPQSAGNPPVGVTTFDISTQYIDMGFDIDAR